MEAALPCLALERCNAGAQVAMPLRMRSQTLHGVMSEVFKPADQSGRITLAILTALLTYIPAAQAANRSPGISSGTPRPSVDVGDLWTFKPYAWDHDGDTLVFSARNLPSWLSIAKDTGRVRGTPGTGNVGTYQDIVLSVSDGKATASLAPFSIKVLSADGTAPPEDDSGSGSSGTTAPSDPDNRAPGISGTPPTDVSVGDLYTFKPYAWDHDGDSLKFVMQNKPAWLTLDSSTGRVRGTPTSSNAGTYSNVTIGVTDGKTTSTLKPFSISVLQSGSASGSVSLSWQIPTRNSDGSTLTNLAGYKIRYGTSSASLTRVIKITNPSVTRYVVDDLSSGTWYFAMTSYNTQSVESQSSSVVSKRL
jgi:hypothetical protein